MGVVSAAQAGGSGCLRGVVLRGWPLARRVDGWEEIGDLAGVDLGVVAVTVVHQNVHFGGLLRQLRHLRRPLRQLLFPVPVAEPGVDISALSLLTVPMEPCHRRSAVASTIGGIDERYPCGMSTTTYGSAYEVRKARVSAAFSGDIHKPLRNATRIRYGWQRLWQTCRVSGQRSPCDDRLRENRRPQRRPLAVPLSRRRKATSNYRT
jgi:hypothetical protein